MKGYLIVFLLVFTSVLGWEVSSDLSSVLTSYPQKLRLTYDFAWEPAACLELESAYVKSISCEGLLPSAAYTVQNTPPTAIAQFDFSSLDSYPAEALVEVCTVWTKCTEVETAEYCAEPPVRRIRGDPPQSLDKGILEFVFFALLVCLAVVFLAIIFCVSVMKLCGKAVGESADIVKGTLYYDIADVDANEECVEEAV